jgi:hypothetical protein
MSSRKIVLRNKARGRAFQSKLSVMASGMNVGTLGNEDVMHEHFSYEAKTYDAKAKSHPRPWVGWRELFSVDFGRARRVFAIAEIRMTEDPKEDLLLMRWHWWDMITRKAVIPSPITSLKPLKRFIGNTWLEQAEANAEADKMPVAVVHTVGERHYKDIVIVRRMYWDVLLEMVRQQQRRQ